MKQIIIEPSGRAFVRSYTDHEVDIRREVASALSEKTAVHVYNMGSLADRTGDEVGVKVDATVTADGGSQLWVAHLNSLRFLSSIRSREGIVSLDFDSEAAAIELVWTPPYSMHVVLAIDVYQEGRFWYSDKCYLMALDIACRAYRLPVANVFDDSSVCMGAYNQRAGSVIKCVQQAYAQFRAAPWNADLYSTKNDEFKLKTQQLFKWKASNEGFEQIMDNEVTDWIPKCERIANDVTARVATLLTGHLEDNEPEDEDGEPMEDGDNE